MAFMNFNEIFSSKNRLHFFTIEKKNELKLTFISDYTLAVKNEYSLKKEVFSYKSLQENLFEENDEILAFLRGRKIILFKNFTQNTNNFKTSLLSQYTLLGFLFIATLFFLFVILNAFSFLDLLFLLACLMLFSVSFINFSVLIKQIRLLKDLDKDKVRKLFK